QEFRFGGPRMRSITELCDLSGQVAIVTGSGGGLGYGIADRLAEAGAAVVINDVNPTNASKAIEQLQEAGRRLAIAVGDVSQRDDVKRTLGVALKAFGRVDILINNAAIYPRHPVLEMTEEQWDQVMAINLRGVFLCSQVIAQQMIAQSQGGKIVNIASRSGLGTIQHDLVAYATSKAGVLHYTRVLARALAEHRIRVNAIAPAATDTEGAVAGSLVTAASIPLGRRGQPDDIARAALFLVSDMAEWVTGITLPIDGGALVM
ncbi:MAG: SDR family oxidoreductase, partial [Dehalococcoidia bacterium]|nr:SDR family oxidoreductase [Dehalococcoidia bacterium]